VVGNARFLILPHVRVQNLASFVLCRAARRLPTGWQGAYGYAPVLIETFVQTPRFTGASYKAANWIHVGTTKGRGKLDRYNEDALPVKDVYLSPLRRATSVCSAHQHPRPDPAGQAGQPRRRAGHRRHLRPTAASSNRSRRVNAKMGR
jgi:hypothetical protein